MLFCILNLKQHMECVNILGAIKTGQVGYASVQMVKVDNFQVMLSAWDSYSFLTIYMLYKKQYKICNSKHPVKLKLILKAPIFLSLF